MTLLDRIILSIAALAIAGILVMSFCLLFVEGSLVQVTQVLQYASTVGHLELWVIGLVALALVISLFCMAFRRPRVAKAVISDTSLGKIKISVDAIHDLVLKAVRQIEDVKSADVTIDVTDEHTILGLTICVLPDIDIPAVCEMVQSTLKDYVKTTVGISVENIDILVRNVVTEKKPRVE